MKLLKISNLKYYFSAPDEKSSHGVMGADTKTSLSLVIMIDYYPSLVCFALVTDFFQ